MQRKLGKAQRRQEQAKLLEHEKWLETIWLEAKASAAEAEDNEVKDGEFSLVCPPVSATTPIPQATIEAEQGLRGRLHGIMKKTQDLLRGKMTGVASSPGSFLSGLRGSMERLQMEDNRIECQIASLALLRLLPQQSLPVEAPFPPQQSLPVEAPFPVLSSLRDSIERLAIDDTRIECKIVSVALLALLPKRVEQPGKNPTKKYPRTKVIIKGARRRRKERRKPRKEVKRSARDGNIGGDWGSEESRDAKLAKALESENMASKSKSGKIAPWSHIGAGYQTARHTLSNICSNMLPLLRNEKTPIAEIVDDVLLDKNGSDNPVSSEPQVSFFFGYVERKNERDQIISFRNYLVSFSKHKHACTRMHTHVHTQPRAHTHTHTYTYTHTTHHTPRTHHTTHTHEYSHTLYISYK